MGHGASSKISHCHPLLHIKFWCQTEHGNDWFKKENDLAQKLEADFCSIVIRLFEWHLIIILLKITTILEKKEQTQKEGVTLQVSPSHPSPTSLPWERLQTP